MGFIADSLDCSEIDAMLRIAIGSMCTCLLNLLSLVWLCMDQDLSLSYSAYF